MNKRLEVDLELIRKYNRPGPRYTSYPPATQFRTEVPWDAVTQRILTANQTLRPLSLYFHIPFCESLCWFCGCTTVITTSRNQSAAYIDRLIQEMDLMQQWIRPDRPVVQVHLGGGTPTFCPPDQLVRLCEAMRQRFQIMPEAEMGVEVDPRRLTREHLRVLRSYGFNRLSLGVQDHHPVVQKAVHRIQPPELTRQTIEWARELGYQSVNIDLIYGLPYQTVDSFARTLEEILELRPERLVVFSYAHVPWMKPAQKILERTGLPSPEVKLQLLKLSIERLTQAGYVYIGMDHFALPEDELVQAQRNGTLQRNFQGYSTHGEADILAFGMSAISQVPDAYWQNQKELSAYQNRIDAGQPAYLRGYLLSDEDRLRRAVIMQIMCNLGVDYQRIEQDWGIRFSEHFARELEALRELEQDGLVRLQSDRLIVTDIGRLLVRVVAMTFDTYLAPTPTRRHAMTV